MTNKILQIVIVLLMLVWLLYYRSFSKEVRDIVGWVSMAVFVIYFIPHLMTAIKKEFKE